MLELNLRHLYLYQCLSFTCHVVNVHINKKIFTHNLKTFRLFFTISKENVTDN